MPRVEPATAWDAFAQAQAVVVFARAIGAVRSGDVERARQELRQLGELKDRLVSAKNDYWAGQVNIQMRQVTAWIARAEGRNDEALTLAREAVAMEAATEKHPVTPGPLLPARELLGELLLDLDQPKLALQAFETARQTDPNRWNSWFSAGLAAERAGDELKARVYFERLLALAKMADADVSDVAHAKAVLERARSGEPR